MYLIKYPSAKIHFKSAAVAAKADLDPGTIVAVVVDAVVVVNSCVDDAAFGAAFDAADAVVVEAFADVAAAVVEPLVVGQRLLWQSHS